MEVQRSIQGTRWIPQFGILAMAVAMSLHAGACTRRNRDSDVSTVNHKPDRRFILLMADNIEVDANTAVVRAPTPFPVATPWSSEIGFEFPCKWGLLTSDETVASRVGLVLDVLAGDISDSDRRVILAMMTPISLGVSTRLDLK